MIWHRIDETPPPMDGTDLLFYSSWDIGCDETAGEMWVDAYGPDGDLLIWPVLIHVADYPTHWAHITPPEDGEKQKAPTVK